MEPVSSAALPFQTLALAEALCEKLDCGHGDVTIELKFHEGRLLHLWRHEKHKGSELDQFNGEDAEG